MPVLLVIDDVWQRGQLIPFLTGAANCKRVITTRNRWLASPEARAILVEGMEPNEAHALLTNAVPGIPDPLVQQLLAATGSWPVLLSIVNRSINQLTRYGMPAVKAAKRLLGSAA